MDDPAHVPRLQRPQAQLPVRRRAIPQRRADVAHRLDEAIAAARVDRLEQGVDLGPGRGLGCGEHLAAGVGQGEQPMLAMIGADLARRESAREEAGDDAAQMRLVHVERPADLRRGPAALGRLGQFVENPRLRQRQVGRRQAAVQEADLEGVKPIEGADLVGQRHGDASVRVLS